MRDDLPFTYRPIDVWPGEPTKHRRRSDFSSGWGKTLQLLISELRHLGARQIVAQVALTERDFRVTDGHPRANAKAAHPGVILAFESKHGPLKFYCDTFTDFDDNMRAIALGLEALRKVERYGITHRDEQYAGWKAIGSGTAMGARMSKDEAAKVLADLSGEPMDGGDIVVNLKGDVDLGTVERAYKSAAKIHHPDRGGNPDLMARATEARDVLVAP